MAWCGEVLDLGNWKTFLGRYGKEEEQVREFGNYGVTREEVGAIQDRREGKGAGEYTALGEVESQYG